MQTWRYPLLLLLLGFWLGASVLIDFVVVPTVFRSGLDFFAAGDVGIALFTKFNFVEVALALAVLILARKKIISSVLLVIVLLYVIWLTPKIASVTALWKISTNGMLGSVDLQQQHQFHHRLYIGLDTLKMLLLSIQIPFTAKGER